MVYKIKNRLLLSSLIVLVLIYFILIENPLYINLMNSILGSLKFYSFFDRIKFFLPIILLLSITSDYLSYMLEKDSSIIVTRFKNRRKLAINIFREVSFSVFIFWSIIMFLSVVLSIYFKNNIEDIFNINFLIVFITGYFFYNMIAMIQLFISIFLDANISFVIVAALTVNATLVTNNFIKYILLIPIGMGINNNHLAIGIIRTIVLIIISITAAMIIYKKIERLDIG